MTLNRKKTEWIVLQSDLKMNNMPVSRRECDVLNQLSYGACNQELAGILGVTISTVEKHLTNIYKKIGVRSRTEAILWWLEKSGVFHN